ncbi:hypothetical protein BEP19_09685 [Ammoniphilus oxalaticus]|uniref:IDEAL domain-containing protein n=1 Tax=Ammoniphilus oxalaticus TaxID=66863 RepID=A0A419SKX0_9BACL|nr:hypothetical protein [Ammoniphilus oxalaticus]RKD24635.1 hypothetical protein BEP19_09685 [Ammoniphilus oxalaticus]
MMKTKVRFKKGDMVRVINPNNHFFNEVAEILLFDVFTNKYLLQFNNGYKSEMYHYDLAKYLTYREQRALQKAHLFQLADLALNVKDREWFDEIAKRLKDYKN